VPTTLSEFRSYPRSLLYVLVLGLTVRLLFISLHERPLISDEREYHALASSLASTGSYQIDGSPTAYRPVGYPAFVAMLYFIVGQHPAIVKVLQAVLDVATAFLLFLLLSGHSNRTRVLAAGLWALFPAAIGYVNFLMSESVYAFLLTFTCYLFTRLGDQTKKGAILLGACIGILVLMKPGTLLLLVFLPFALSRAAIQLRTFFPAVVACMLVLAPWAIRNYIVFDRVALSSNSGINLLIGNNPHTTGAYGITFDTQVLEGAKGEFETDRQAFAAASDYIAGHPGMFALNAVKKIGHLFESEGGLLVWTFHSDPEGTRQRYSSKYASLPLPLTFMVNLPYFLAMILGVLGFLQSRKDALWWFTICLMSTWLLLHAFAFGGGRFHFPLMPFVVLFASVSLTTTRASLVSLPRFEKVAGSFVILSLVLLWVYEGVLIYHG
jgi:4-amino-4-deoxy-L-arabinose transferase-like glycosyltransferase